MKNTENPIKISYSKYGTPDEILVLETLPLINPGPKEVAIRLLAAPVNPVDKLMMMGYLSSEDKFPIVPGLEGVGEIYKIGDSVDKSLIHKIVRMPMSAGTWRDIVIANVDELLFIPDGIRPEIASMAFINPPTAWCLIHDFISLKSGDWIIQNAANSAVGTCVIQLAKHFGYKTINIVRDPFWEKPLKQMGADVVLQENSKWAKDSQYLSKAKLAFNPIGGPSVLDLMSALVPEGVHISYGMLSNDPTLLPVADLMRRNTSMRGFSLFYRANNSSQEEMKKIMNSIFDLMKKGVIDIPVEKVYALQDVKKAIAHAEGYHRKGKILLNSNWSPKAE